MIKEANSLEEVDGQLTRVLAIGVGPWNKDKDIVDKTKSDMRWIDSKELEKLEEIMEWCRVKYSKQFDAVITEHIHVSPESPRFPSVLHYRKWFDVRLSFNDPNAALEFKMVWE